MNSSPPSWAVLLAAMLWAGPLAQAADKSVAAIFDADPGHPWNQLYADLAVAAEPGADQQSAPGNVAGLEPLLRKTLAALDDFNNTAPGTPARPLMHRAVMQRQMLANFHGMAALQGAPKPGESGRQSREEVLAALAKAIQRLSLSADQIRALPDNYLMAAQQPGTVLEFDCGKPAAFLPRDLFQEDGPWVGLELTPGSGRQGVVAEFHFRMMQGAASFEVRMRHPQGRAAGAAYLKALAEMPQPYLAARTDAAAELKPNGPDGQPWPNPDTPQFPAGTAWALVQRVVLADTAGQPVVSPLVEAVQIRVYQTIRYEDALLSPGFLREAKAWPAPLGEEEQAASALPWFQTPFEWAMRGPDLLEKKGFHLATAGETLFGRGAHGNLTLNTLCISCHSATGIHSVNSRAAGGFHDGILTAPPAFQPASRLRIDQTTIKAARNLPGWVELRKHWPKP